jgi:hypothetical protein
MVSEKKTTKEGDTEKDKQQTKQCPGDTEKDKQQTKLCPISKHKRAHTQNCKENKNIADCNKEEDK